YLGLIVCLIFLTFSIFNTENYLDMKRSYYGIPFITIISSLSLILLIKMISLKISKFYKISQILIKIGKSSLVIMYLHQPIQILIQTKVTTNLTIRFLFSLLISYLIYLLLSQYIITRALFLGSNKDFKFLKNKYL
ncbi:MAG: hypothetical protein NTW25_11125, partial [Candidatus Kapabacteria bacterium]|nr:hypothetical protein [Candidatus Kapabacteria bacterium]